VLDARKENEGYYKEYVKKYGFDDKGYNTYGLGTSDFGPQLQSMQGGKPEAVLIFGLSGDTSNFVKQIDAAGAAYVDTPTAKAGGAWHPHLMGSPGGTGDHTWADLAGASAKVGTITAWHVGGLLYLPDCNIRKWISARGDTPTGGEESPADATWALLKGIEKAGTVTDHDKVISAIETQGDLTFANLPFGFASDRHLSKTRDDMIIVTLERKSGPVSTNPPYKLGHEWEVEGAINQRNQPVQLVRPTLSANKKAFPDAMQTVLKDRYGTQCTLHSDGTMGKECKIH